MIAENESANADRRERRQARNILVVFVAVALAIAAFVAAAPWLRETLGHQAMIIMSFVFGLAVLVGAEYFSLRHSRQLDEVQLTSQRFATRWGAWAGQIVFIVLLLLPPFHEFAAWVVAQFAGDAVVDARAVSLAMVFGFGCLALLQAIATVASGLIWWTRSQR